MDGRSPFVNLLGRIAYPDSVGAILIILLLILLLDGATSAYQSANGLGSPAKAICCKRWNCRAEVYQVSRQLEVLDIAFVGGSLATQSRPFVELRINCAWL